MITVRIRLTGSETDASELMTMLHGLSGIEHVEQVDDAMPYMDGLDSSSAGLTDDIGPGVHAIEIEARGPKQAERVREFASEAAEAIGAAVEFVDDF